MWFVWECAGVACGMITYVIVFVVQWGMVRIALWEGLQAGEESAYWHFWIFQYHCLMILWSHIKCMTTEPGVLPILNEKLDFDKFSPDLQGAFIAISDEVKILEKEAKIMAAKAEKESNAVIPIDPKKQSLDEIERILTQNIENVKKQKLESQTYQVIKYMKNIVSRIEGMRKSPDLKKTSIEVTAGNMKALNSIFSKYCRKCQAVKPPQSHHCSTCGRCIGRMDHHCPWVNNCVGFYNQKFFLQFLLYVALGSFHALFLIVYQSYLCMELNCFLFKSTWTCALAGVSIFLAILFGLFVVIMFFDQMYCIITNSSTIDNLQKERNPNMESGKGEKAANRTAWQNLKEVFGGPLSIWWLIPTMRTDTIVVEKEYD